MSKIKVKPEYKKHVFGFNNSGKPLGERDDLHLLIADAKAGNVKHILDMFETVDDKDIEGAKLASFNKKQAAKKRAAAKDNDKK